MLHTPPYIKIKFYKSKLTKRDYNETISYICSFYLLPLQTQPMNISINQLTLDQKIGQLFMVAAVADEEIAKDFLSKKSYRMDKEYIEQLITHYHIGGIIYLGKSDTEKQIERTQYFQSISAIPLLIGQDLEPGRVGISRLASNAKISQQSNIGTDK